MAKDPIGMAMRVEGLGHAMTELNTNLLKVGGDLAYKGLLRGGILILADAQRNAPRDTGNLMGSGYIIGRKGVLDARVTTRPHPKKPEETAAITQNVVESQADLAVEVPPGVLIGFGASYSLFVHEGDPDADWHDGGPHFLVNAVDENHFAVLNMVAEEVRKI